MELSRLTPLLANNQNQNMLSSSILDVCNQKKEALTPCQRNTKIGLNTVAIGFSLIAKIFYVSIALKTDRLIGTPANYISAICNIKAFASLEIWAARAMIADLLRSKAGEPNEKNDRNLCAKISLVSIAGILALLSQIPTAYPAAIYNKDYMVLAGLVTLVASVFIPARSIQLSLKDAINKIYSIKKNSDLLKLQKESVNLLKESKYNFIQMSPVAKNRFIQKLSSTRAIMAPQEQLNQYVQAIFLNSSDTNNVAPSIYKRCWSATGAGVGYILTGILQYAIAKYTFVGTKNMIWDSDAAAGFFAALVTASCVYLYGQSIAATSERIFNAPWNWVIGTQQVGLGEQLRPRISKSLKIEEAITNVFALGPSVIIWGDFFNKPDWQHWFFEISICAAIYALILTASLDTIDEILQRFPSNVEGAKWIQTSKEFGRIERLIKNSSQTSFAEWLSELPDNVQTELCKKANLTPEQLNTCISKVRLENLDQSAQAFSDALMPGLSIQQDDSVV